ncbi:putative quinol monooxygenase [Streptomyces tendae]|uniref:putative quinol monooxygenase n=1 Tax=Streptomyces tendae TaxID=1932 RepID=UPI003654706B
MFSRIVTVRILPGVQEDFLAAISANADASVRDEPGCVRFDVCADREDSLRFHLYEVYTDADAAEAHRSTPHYLAWRASADRYVEPGTQVIHSTDLVHCAH